MHTFAMNWNKLISAKRFGMEEFHEVRQENQLSIDKFINHQIVNR